MMKVLSAVDDRCERYVILAHGDRLPVDKRRIEGPCRPGQHSDRAILDRAPSFLQAALSAQVGHANNAALSKADVRALNDEATDWAKGATKSQLRIDSTFRHSAR
jgi:hypothetical protein